MRQKMSDAEIVNLALRPKRLSEMVGQTLVVKALRKQGLSKRRRRTYIFTGPTGTGKTTIAKIVGLSFQCTHSEFGDPCDSCWGRREAFQITEVNASFVRGVEQIGKIAEVSMFAPSPPSSYRVFILDEAHRMTTEAQNLLLKFTEEPPKTTVWIICTTDPHKILPTLRARFLPFPMRSLTTKTKTILLKRAAKAVGYSGSITELVEASDEVGLGNPRGLLTAFELYSSGMKAKEAVASYDSGVVFDSFRVGRALVRGDWTVLRSVLMDMSPEHSRWVRGSVAGYLRGMVFKSSSSKSRSIASRGLERVLSPAPLEDNLLRDWLVGVLYSICAEFRR